MTPACKYQGTYFDPSGYGEANRNFITALYLAGVNITTERVIQVSERAEFGWTGNLCKQLENLDIDYKIKIIHLTPDLYPKYMESGKYHIGHLFWETDLLPKEWIAPCNKMDEIWTASPRQQEIFKKSGVKTPTYCFPQAIDMTYSDKNIVPYQIADFKGMVFYSIFQWIERKNPRALLTSFWKAFEGKKDVCLVIKTYGQNYSDEEFERIKREAFEWKRQLNLLHYPKVFLVRKLMSTEETYRLHETGDCFVLATRGEGWGIPVTEACLRNKPVISIDKTGVLDFLPKTSYFPCSTDSTEVTRENSISWYVNPQNWLNISEDELRKNLLEVYNERLLAKEKADKAKAWVSDNLDYWRVGNLMKERLSQIQV